MPGATYDAAAGGLLVGGMSIDQFVGTDDTATALAALQAKGIQPVSKALNLDLGALVSGLDPSGGFFGHDKVEGVATLDGGRTIVVSNDSDFGISGLTGDTPPFTLTPRSCRTASRTTASSSSSGADRPPAVSTSAGESPRSY